MRLADEIRKAINNKQFKLSVVIDLEKALDLVWHNGLLYIMKQDGLRGNVFKSVEEFLNDRSIQVRVGSAMSSTYFLEWNASEQCAEPTTVHHNDQRLARIVKRRQARTVRGLQFNVEIWSEPVSLVQRRTQRRRQNSPKNGASRSRSTRQLKSSSLETNTSRQMKSS